MCQYLDLCHTITLKVYVNRCVRTSRVASSFSLFLRKQNRRRLTPESRTTGGGDILSSTDGVIKSATITGKCIMTFLLMEQDQWLDNRRVTRIKGVATPNSIIHCTSTFHQQELILKRTQVFESCWMKW
jgi:hypothetical protein